VSRFLIRRLITGLLTLFLVTILVFLLIHLAPGDALAEGMAESGLQQFTPEGMAQLRHMYHLDQPLYRQYMLWLTDLLHADLGRSLADRQPVVDKIRARLGISFQLNSLALGLMVVLAVPIGALAAWRPGSRFDRYSALATYMFYALPVFWAGLLLQLCFAIHLNWLPLAGLVSDGSELLSLPARLVDRLAHLALPVVCLSYGGLAFLSRFVRATLIDNAAGEATRAARARGLSEFAVLIRHGFRQAAVPMLTLAGLLLPALVSGSVIVETIFAIPGLGRLFIDAAFARDLPVLMGLTLLSGVATLAGIIAADIAYLVLDPRMRRG
jgi:peptide/nickel transport system permease protein